MASPSSPDLQALVNEQAQALGVDPDMVMKIIMAESNGDPRAIGRLTDSGEHAQGLMQLMPENQRKYGVTDPFDPAQNVRAGATLWRDVLKQHNGDVRRALVDYNGGPKAVAAYNAGTPWKESAGYLERIMPDEQNDDPRAFIRKIRKPATPSADDPRAFVKDLRSKPAEPQENALTGLEEGLRQSLPGPTYDLVVGALKKMGKTIGDITGLNKVAPNVEVAGQPLDKLMEPSNTTQKIGGVGADAATFAVPSTAADALALKLTGNASPVLRLLARSGAQAGVGALDAELQGRDPKTEAAIAATGPVVGEAAGLAGPLLKGAGRKIIETALKTPVSVLNASSDILGTTLPQKLSTVVDTILKHKVSNPEQAEAVIRALEGQLDVPVDAATAAGVQLPTPKAAQDALTAAQQRLEGVASRPGERIGALQAEKDALINEAGSHSMPGPPVVTLKPGTGFGGQPTSVTTPGPRVLKPGMTPRETLDSARAADTRWESNVPNAVQDARKITEVAERDTLKKGVPETEPILAEQGKMIVTKNALDREALRRANQDLFSFGGLSAMHALRSPLEPSGIIGLGHMVLRQGGPRLGIWADQLGNFLERGDVQAVAMILRGLGYGAALDALPKTLTK